MDGHLTQWDEIIGLLLKLSEAVHDLKDAERLGHRPSAIRSPPVIISEELGQG